MRDVASVARIERPRAPPTCRVVLTRPEASPESLAVAPDMARTMSAGNDRPPPMPSNSIAGRRSATYSASTGARVSSASPPIMRVSPDTNTARAPKRVFSRAEKPSESVPIASATGRNASPTSTGP